MAVSARLWAVALVALAALVAVAAAVAAHAAPTFEPAVARVSVKRPAFAPKNAHGDLPAPLATAVAFVKTWAPETEFVVKNYYVTKRTGVAHVYLRQIVNGLEVANGDANINIDRNGAISSASHSFFRGATVSFKTTPHITAADAARVLATFVGARPGDIKAVHANGAFPRAAGGGGEETRRKIAREK